MELLPPNVLDEHCKARQFLSFIANKWILLILLALEDGRKRNGELMRLVEGISQKMLTQRLRELEAMGLVVRHDMQTVPPHVEYELSDIGVSLRRELKAVDRWISDYIVTCEQEGICDIAGGQTSS